MAARKIGATIALDGEKEFKSAVSNCNKSLKEMRSEMNLVKEKTAGQANSLSTLKEKHEVLTRTLEKYKEKQTAVASGLEHARSDYERVGKTLENYKTQLSEAQKELDDMKASGTASQEEMDKQQAKVDELAATVSNGEKAYEKAGNRVKDWQTQLNNADAEVVKANRSLSENDQYMAEAEQSTNKCATSIDNFGKKTSGAVQQINKVGDAAVKQFKWDSLVSGIEKVSGAITELASKSYDAARELDKGYDTITAKTGATGEAMQKMSGIANSLYSSMAVSMDDIGSAVGEVNTRFGLQGDQLEELSGQFLKYAELNGTDVSSSIDTVQKSLSAFGLSANQASDVLDLFNKVGQDTGISVDTLSNDLVSNAASFTEMGMSIDQAANFLGACEKSGTDVSVVMQGLKKAMKNASDEGVSLDDALSSFSATMQSNASDTEKLQAAYDLFGSKAGAAIYGACKTGSLSLSDLTASVENYGGSVARTFEETEDPWDKAQEAMHSLQIAGSDLTQSALGALTPAIEKVADVADGAAETFGKWPNSIKAIIGVSGLALTGMAKVAPTVSEIIRTYSAWIAAKGTSTAATAAETAATTAQTTATEAATVAQTGLNTAMDANPIGLVALAIGAVVTGLTIYANVAGTATDKSSEFTSSLDAAAAKSEESTAALRDATNAFNSNLSETFNSANESISGAVASAQMAGSIIDELDALNQQESLTSDQQQRMAQDVSVLNTLYPGMGATIDETTGKLNMSTQSMRDFVEQAKQTAMIQAYVQAYKSVIEESTDALEKQIKAQMDAKQVTSEAADVQKQLGPILEDYNTKLNRETELQDKMQSGQSLTNHELNEYNRLTNEVRDGQIKVNGEWENAFSLQQQYNDALSKSTKAQKDYHDATDAAKSATSQMNNEMEALKSVAEKNGVSFDEINDAMNQTGKTAETTGESLNGLTESADGQSDAIDGAAESNEAYAGSADAVTGANSVQIQSFAELRQAAIDELSSASDAFKKYESDSDVSLQSMAEALQSQAQAYNNYADNINTVMSDTRYQTDSNFRAMADSIMNMGMDGADYLQQFSDAVRSGSSDVASITADYGNMEAAKGRYASNIAAMEYYTQDGVSNMVSTIAGASGDVASAAGSTAQAGANAVKGKEGQYTNSGRQSASNYASGIGSQRGNVSGQASGVASGADRAMQLNKTYQYGINIGVSYASGIASQYGNARSAAQGLANGASSALSSIGGSAYTWGSHLGAGFASGIASQYGNVASSANALARAAARYIHHTTPDVGPLAGDDKWGAELATQFAAGMRQNIGAVASASEAMAGAVARPEISDLYRSQKYGSAAGESRTINLYIDGIKYNTDSYIDGKIDDFVKDIIRKGAMYSG
ncbi:phage tail tape measure protein [Bilifractor sp. LCP21S3_A7]|uniref:phage tail tape measure protein n=1 Tax=Bilifractor sp. LCP21S3_A7 TaxID=3438738 RepID=UPI003F8E6223